MDKNYWKWECKIQNSKCHSGNEHGRTTRDRWRHSAKSSANEGTKNEPVKHNIIRKCIIIYIDALFKLNMFCQYYALRAMCINTLQNFTWKCMNYLSICLICGAQIFDKNITHRCANSSFRCKFFRHSLRHLT